MARYGGIQIGPFLHGRSHDDSPGIIGYIVGWTIGIIAVVAMVIVFWPVFLVLGLMLLLFGALWVAYRLARHGKL